MAAGEEGVDQLFSALAHPLRRRIIVLLRRRGEMGFSELLRETGVESSVLSFHLRRLGGLVEKTSGGSYRLTGLGRRAALVLDCLEGRRGVEAEGLRVAGQQVVVIGEDLLLEGYRAGGLFVEGSLLVAVEKGVSRSLYRKTLRGLEALVVYVPEDLYAFTAARARAEAVVAYSGRLPFNPSIPRGAVEDLERRGFRALAAKLREVLGAS